MIAVWVWFALGYVGVAVLFLVGFALAERAGWYTHNFDTAILIVAWPFTIAIAVVSLVALPFVLFYKWISGD